MPPYKFTPEHTKLSLIEKELRPLEDIASSAETIANSAKTHSELAVEKSKKADIKGWIAVAISFACFLNFCVSHIFLTLLSFPWSPEIH